MTGSLVAGSTSLRWCGVNRGHSIPVRRPKTPSSDGAFEAYQIGVSTVGCLNNMLDIFHFFVFSDDVGIWPLLQKTSLKHLKTINQLSWGVCFLLKDAFFQARNGPEMKFFQQRPAGGCFWPYRDQFWAFGVSLQNSGWIQWNILEFSCRCVIILYVVYISNTHEPTFSCAFVQTRVVS